MTSNKQSPFQVRGIVEGFYGVFYTFPERNDLIKFAGQNGYNLYIYGPKNDRQHRARWWDPYPEAIMRKFQETVAIGQAHGVEFNFAISPISMQYSSAADRQTITTKLRGFYDIGVRSFSLLIDDIAAELPHEGDRQKYQSYAEAHVDISNYLYHWLQELDPACRLMVCPTYYHGRAPFHDYIYQLGQEMHPEIDIFYTGTDICSVKQTTANTAEFAEAIKRLPILWDNYPVNDLELQDEMHIGPIDGRDATLHQTVRGIVVNTMSQAEASKIALLTYRDYFFAPEEYNPEDSWENSLHAIAGVESYPSLRLFAENSLYSCLNPVEAEKMDTLTESVLTVFQQNEPIINNPQIAALKGFFDQLDEATYHLKFRMANLALRNNLLPWIELLEHWFWMGRRGIMVLEALEKGESYGRYYKMMQESLEAITKHPKRIAGQKLYQLAEEVAKRVANFTKANTPDLDLHKFSV